MSHVERAGVAQPGERDMRGEFARVGRYAQALADAFDLGLQGVEFGRGGDARPYRMRLLLPESADTRKRQRKARAVDTVERLDDLVGNMTFDIADETQGEVIVLDVYPAGA